ncbi:MAG: hypothetical protein ACKOOH_08080, partial [Cyanobium sp.]
MSSLTSRRRVLQWMLATVPTSSILSAQLARASPSVCAAVAAGSVRMMMPAPRADATATAGGLLKRRHSVS